MENFETLKACASEALDVAGACNISGVATSLINSIKFLRSQGLGGDELQKHPIIKLYAYQIAELSGLECIVVDYLDACRECEAITDR